MTLKNDFLGVFGLSDDYDVIFHRDFPLYFCSKMAGKESLPDIDDSVSTGKKHNNLPW